MGDINAKVPSRHYMPSTKELLVHVLLDLFGDLLLVGTVLHGMTDDVFGLELHLGLHLRVEHFDAPFLSAFQVFGVH